MATVQEKAMCVFWFFGAGHYQSLEVALPNVE
jgi:hypothetical protein